MDPATVIGLIGSLLAIIHASTKLASWIREVSRGLKAAKKQIRRLVREMTAFSGILSVVRACIRDRHLRSEELRIFGARKTKKLMSLITRQAKETIADVDGICPQMEKLESWTKFLEKLKWLRKKEEVKALGWQMHSLTATLNVLMSCVNYEERRLRGEDPTELYVSYLTIFLVPEGFLNSF
jgi:hypothetical protein